MTKQRKTTRDSPRYQVWFLPWADLNQGITIEPVTFSPFRLGGGNEGDEKITAHLRRYFGTYVGYDGKPVEQVVLCVHGAPDFRHLTSDEIADIRRATDALLFSTIYPAVKNGIVFNKPFM